MQLLVARAVERLFVIHFDPFGTGEALEQLAFSPTGNVEVAVVDARERGQHGDAVDAVELDAVARRKARGRPDDFILVEHSLVGLHRREHFDFGAVDPQDGRFGKLAVIGLLLKQLIELVAAWIEFRQAAVHIACHNNGFGSHVVALVDERGIRDVDRIVYDLARAVGKPELEARLDQQRGEDGDRDRRHGSDHREERDEAHVELPLAHPLPRAAAAGDEPREKNEQNDGGDEIADHQERDHRRAQQVGRAMIVKQQIGRIGHGRDEDDGRNQRCDAHSRASRGERKATALL